MTIGVSLILIAVGAILIWGVTEDAEGLNVDAIGVILMIVGFVGALLSLVLWSEWSPAYRGRRRVYVDDDVAVRRRAVRPVRREVVEEEEIGPGPPAGPPP
jgi:hypothetical protein